MEGGAVRHNFERDPPKDHPCQVWFNSVQGFQRRRFKCESTYIYDGRTPSDGKSSHGLWPGELKSSLSKLILTRYNSKTLKRILENLSVIKVNYVTFNVIQITCV